MFFPWRQTLTIVLLPHVFAACGQEEGAVGRAHSDETGGDATGGSSPLPGAGGGSTAPEGGSGGGGGGSGGAREQEGGSDAEPPATLFCAGSGVGVTSFHSFDIWSDDRGPFVLTATEQRTRVYNRGTEGWAEIAPNGIEPRQTRLTGVSGGDLLLYGSLHCGVSHMAMNGAAFCGAGVSSVADVFVVGPNLAYAVHGDTVIAYRGGDYWVTLGRLPSDAVTPVAYKLWADGDRVFVIAGAQVFSADSNGSLSTVEVSHDMRYESIWGSEGSELWLGRRDGSLIVYDLELAEWAMAGKVSDPCAEDGIRGIWGAQDALFIHTDHRLARVTQTGIEVLHDWSCDESVLGVWGNSATEVYMVAMDRANQPTECGPVAVYVFDGAEMTQL